MQDEWLLLAMCNIGLWLDTHANKIQAGAAIVGVIVGIVGFAATVSQLSSATNALQASNGYQIQKDAREIVDKLSDDKDFLAALNGATISDAKVFDRKLWEMFNFYLSVYRQSTVDGVSRKFAESFSKDFCRFLRKPVVSARWGQMQQSGMLGENHAEMQKSWCGSTP